MMMKVFREGLEGLVLKDVNVIQYYFLLNIVIRYQSSEIGWFWIKCKDVFVLYLVILRMSRGKK